MTADDPSSPVLTRGEKDRGGGRGGEITQSRLGCPKLRTAVAQLYPCVRSCTNAGGAVIHSECRILGKSILYYSIRPNADNNKQKSKSNPGRDNILSGYFIVVFCF